jgi:hypothetical protein
MSGVQVTELLSRAAYRESRSHLYPSETSLAWYLRQHKAGLVQCGALLLHGNRWLINAAKMDAYVVDAGAAAAQRQCIKRSGEPSLNAGQVPGGMRAA